MKKWTVSCNHTEYCEGLFETEKEADIYREKLIRADEPDVSPEMSHDEVLDYDCDGYYRTLEISI